MATFFLDLDLELRPWHRRSV